MSDGFGSDKRTIVIAVTFIAIYTLILTALAPVFASAEDYQGDYTNVEGWTMISGLYYSLWTPKTGGYSTYYKLITNASVLDHWDTSTRSNTYLWEFGTDDVWISVIRGNTLYDPNSNLEEKKYEDFVMVERYTPVLWILPAYTKKAISLEEIEMKQTSSDDFSVPVSVGESFSLLGNMTLNGKTFEERLYWNEWSMRFGKSSLQEAEAKTNTWAILGSLLTMQLPAVHWVIQAIIAVPFWTAIAVVATNIIRSWLPW